jgi:squalene-hopene/tetraprenyl-beta-curcumene cyclase
LDFSERLCNARALVRKELLATRTPDGYWAGHLSSSALSTATAVCALSVVTRESAIHNPQFTILVERGLGWLARHANADGGWGDTVLSISNISTTTLCWAAFGLAPGVDEKYRAVVEAAERWLTRHAGGIGPEKLVPAIIRRYGKDRTFSVPILTACVLSGRLGSGASAWTWVLPLPFELAALPHQFFAALRLPVVSYALPALIAIGQARHHHLPSRSTLVRFVRDLSRKVTLDTLRAIQPSSGGFLEATPLTSFVTMSLAGSGQVNHPVTQRGVEFLIASVRADGSWPIDTNLATWVTTLSVNALDAGSGAASTADFRGAPETVLSDGDRARIRDWLLAQQYREVHPYTHAAPGGWAWTDLPGGVPDADDTAGALLALRNLSCRPPSAGRAEHPEGCRKQAVFDERTRAAAIAAIHWLLNLQNADGGLPTFCRGWTNLPFDRSAPDLTAHALRAWHAWLPDLPPDLHRRVRRAIENGVRYLARSQRANGDWLPLWFGNQHAPDDLNPIYGTARVLLALEALEANRFPDVESMVVCGGRFLAGAQRQDGSWGAGSNGASSIEETALAVEALAGLVSKRDAAKHAKVVRQQVVKGAHWLIGKVESGQWLNASPIGFYFAKLWYYEEAYPLIFTVAALSRVQDACDSRAAGCSTRSVF